MDGGQHQLDRRNHRYRSEGLVKAGQGGNIFPEQRRNANQDDGYPKQVSQDRERM